ncbi:MAG: hypothetical protein WD738_21555 [Pirellulales bacterium]
MLRDDVRRRIFYVMQQWADDLSSGTSFDKMLSEIGPKLLVKYGGLDGSMYEAARVSHNPIIDHFFLCSEQRALEFIEIAFTTMGWCGQQGTVDKINEIFLDSETGYELTPFVMTMGKPTVNKYGGAGPTPVDIQFPKAIERGSQFLHTEAVQPAFTLLADNRFKGANDEFLKAHEYFKNGDYPACLNECLKAFESTMKIICHHKSWPYRQEDTASKLVKTCLDNGLLPTYSEQQLNTLAQSLTTTIPTPRNKQSGHGQGVKQNVVTAETAKFSLNSTATTIVFLIESAKL